MNTVGRLAFMTEPPSLDEVLRSDSYKNVRDAATRLHQRLTAHQQSSDSLLTASRTLVETVCKTLLDLLNIEYDNRADLTDINKQLFKSLDLHPSTQTNTALRELCQGTVSMINAMAYLRNAYSDAHGSGQEAGGTLPFQDAELGAYMAIALTRYCVLAYEAKVARKQRADLSAMEVTTLVEIWLSVAKKHGLTNPDNLPYSEPLEEISNQFTQATKIVLPRKDIYLKLVQLRKTKKLPKPELDS